MIKINPSHETLDKIVLIEFVKNEGITLPKDYIDFLEKYNAGDPEPNVITDIACNERKYSVVSFFGTTKNKNFDIVLKYKMYSGRIPSKCIPIGGDPGGNLFCLNVNKNNSYGHVYFWNHEKEVDFPEGKIDISNLTFLSKSFADFIMQIQPDTTNETEMNGYEVVGGWINPDFIKKINGNK